MKKRPTDEEMLGLLTEPHFRREQETQPPPTDPIMPTPMVVEANRIKSYDRNPRRVPNAEYARIKESIRTSGMEQALVITRRPGAEFYIVAAGGNTRLQIVRELWEETGDQRFRRVHCLFRPWAGDANILAAHLKENDLRGDLTFIDRALAIRDFRQLIEAETGEPLSQNHLSILLKERGYQLSQRMIGWFDYTVDVLYPAIPVALRAGMGRPQIERLRDLDRAFGQAWEALELGGTDAAQTVFSNVLARHDADAIDPESLRRDLETELSISAGCDVQQACLILDAVIKGRSNINLQSVKGDRYTSEEDTFEAKRSPESTPFPPAANAVPKNPMEPVPKKTLDDQTRTVIPNEHKSKPEKSPTGVTTGSGYLNKEQTEGLRADLKSLRARCGTLATRIAQLAQLDNIITPIPSGLGFLVAPVPNELLVPRKDEVRYLASLWWSLVVVSEQFARHGKAAQHMPSAWKTRPIGDAMREASQFLLWQHKNQSPEAIGDVPFIPISDLGPFGLHLFSDQMWDTWVDLVSTGRTIHRITKGDPWSQ